MHSWSEDEDDGPRYTTATVPPDVRVFFARVAPALKEAGVSYKRQLEIANNAGYPIKDRSFRRHRHKVELGEAPLSVDKKSGRHVSLLGRQERVFVGWVLHENDANNIVDLDSCQEFLRETFGLDLAQTTIRNYLLQNGFTSHRMRHRTAGFYLDLDQQASLYAADVSRFWGLGLKDMDPSCVVCIDSSSLGWRLHAPRSYTPKGGQQPQHCEGNPSSTNLVVWAVCADGVNRFPALLFTGDASFVGRGRDRHLLPEKLREYKIAESRIISTDVGCYVGESSDTVLMFLKRYPALKKCLILTDKGNAYTKDGIDIIKEWGAKHEVFTPAIHQFISPLDNYCFGIAKGAMRSSRLKSDDRLGPSLLFLHTLDMIKPESIRRMWERNFMLTDNEVDLEAVKKHLRPKGRNERIREDYYDYCKDAYRMDVLKKDPMYTDQPPLKLQHGLDGVYWE